MGLFTHGNRQKLREIKTLRTLVSWENCGTVPTIPGDQITHWLLTKILQRLKDISAGLERTSHPNKKSSKGSFTVSENWCILPRKYTILASNRISEGECRARSDNNESGVHKDISGGLKPMTLQPNKNISNGPFTVSKKCIILPHIPRSKPSHDNG